MVNICQPSSCNMMTAPIGRIMGCVYKLLLHAFGRIPVCMTVISGMVLGFGMISALFSTIHGLV